MPTMLCRDKGGEVRGRVGEACFGLRKQRRCHMCIKKKRKGQQMCREGLEKAFRVYDGSRGGGRVL